jgi:hypothetical protein
MLVVPRAVGCLCAGEDRLADKEGFIDNKVALRDRAPVPKVRHLVHWIATEPVKDDEGWWVLDQPPPQRGDAVLKVHHPHCLGVRDALRGDRGQLQRGRITVTAAPSLVLIVADRLLVILGRTLVGQRHRDQWPPGALQRWTFATVPQPGLALRWTIDVVLAAVDQLGPAEASPRSVLLGIARPARLLAHEPVKRVPTTIAEPARRSHGFRIRRFHSPIFNTRVSQAHGPPSDPSSNGLAISPAALVSLKRQITQADRAYTHAMKIPLQASTVTL